MYKLPTCVFALFLFTTTPSAAESILVVGNQAKAPKISIDDQGNPHGILVDIMNVVSGKTGLDFKISLFPWKRSYRMALKGDAMIVGLSRTDERLKIFDYSPPVFIDTIIAVIRAQDADRFVKIDDLIGASIAVTRGGSYGQKFEDYRPKFKFVETNRPLARLKMLIGNRIDAFFIGPGEAGFRFAFSKLNPLDYKLEQFHIMREVFDQDPNHIGVKKSSKYAKYLPKINAAINTLRESGELQAIIDNYGK